MGNVLKRNCFSQLSLLTNHNGINDGCAPEITYAALLEGFAQYVEHV